MHTESAIWALKSELHTRSAVWAVDLRSGGYKEEGQKFRASLGNLVSSYLKIKVKGGKDIFSDTVLACAHKALGSNSSNHKIN